MIPKEASYLLQDLARKCKDAKERERLRALYAISVGHPIQKVAEIFCVDEGTVYRWIERWQQGKELSDRPKRGRPGAFSDEDKQALKELVDEGDPRKHGIEASFWNTRDLKEHFGKRGKKVSQETIRRCLKEMGARYVKADLDYEGSGRKKRQEFLRQFLDDMKCNPYSAYSVFTLFENMLIEDEMLSECAPKICYGWTFERKLVVRAIQERDSEQEERGPGACFHKGLEPIRLARK